MQNDKNDFAETFMWWCWRRRAAILLIGGVLAIGILSWLS